jgi:hypothetical protein
MNGLGPLASSLLGVIALGFLNISSVAATERTDESKIRSSLQQSGQKLIETQRALLDFSQAAKGETRFNLFYASKEAEFVFLQFYHVRTILDLAIAAESPADETKTRFVLTREAKDLLWAIDQAIATTKQSRPDFRRPDYLKRLDDFLSQLLELRPIVDRIAIH